MTHESKCRFCGAVVMVDVADDFTEFGKKPLSWWLDLAVCNRCGDYHDSLRQWKKHVEDTCSQWNLSRRITEPGPRMDEEALARRRLEKAARNLGSVIARYTQKSNPCVTLEAVQEFVESFLGQPWKAESMLRIFINGAEKQ